MAEAPVSYGDGETTAEDSESAPGSRGTFFAMMAGLAAGYGVLAAVAARFLYPARDRDREWLFVCTLDRLGPDGSLLWKSPSGETIAVARQGAGTTARDLVALSSTCPHLGCQVHWEVAKQRFFCPCHNGAFDPTGKPIAGPPAKENQWLARYELKVERGLVFILVPVEKLALGGREERIVEPVAVTGPGHDPCLMPRSNTHLASRDTGRAGRDATEAC